ncbi:MAG TPA: hypothetical protein VK586_02925 [Streptosporangiaceae bacterium]|nr:hypothetical protein [Streptosporangiaceae bacterium]
MHWPMPTGRELRLEIRDVLQGSHWARGRCWCAAVHAREATTLALIPPPWDASRDDEPAFPTAVAW